MTDANATVHDVQPVSEDQVTTETKSQTHPAKRERGAWKANGNNVASPYPIFKV